MIRLNNILSLSCCLFLDIKTQIKINILLNLHIAFNTEIPIIYNHSFKRVKNLYWVLVTHLKYDFGT